MSRVHIKSTGTRTSGTSDPGDWSDSNCYAIANWSTAVAAIASTPGSQIVFYDETIVIPQLSLNGLTTAGTFYIGSRGDYSILRLTNGTTRAFLYSSATAAITLVFDDLKVSGEGVTWTATSTPLIQVTQNCVGVEMNNCGWVDIRAVSAAHSQPLLMRFAPNTASPTMVMNECFVRGVDVDLTGDFIGFFEIEDDDITWDVHTMWFEDVDVRVTGASDNLGFFYQNSTSLTRLDNIHMNRCFMSAAQNNENVSGLYRTEAASTVIVDGLYVDTVTLDGNANSGALVRISADCTGEVRNFNVVRLFRTGRESGVGGNSVGGVAVSTGDGANLLIEDGIVRESGGFYGTAFYNSGGGSVVARRITAMDIHDNGQLNAGGNDPVNGNAFYSGGDGDATWEFLKALRISGATEVGIAWYLHIAASGSHSKVFHGRNCTFAQTLSTATQPAGFVKSFLDGYTLDATFTNTVFDNGVNEFETDESAAGGITTTLNLTIDHCAIDIGKITHNIVNGTFAFTNNTSAAPLLDEDGAMTENSPLLGGTRWWEEGAPRPSGVDGEPIPDRDIPIGAHASRTAPFHPTQLAA